MWRDTMRDLQWRRRRFVIAIAATALVFAVTLLVGGVADSFRSESRRAVEAMGIDEWIVRKGSIGPVTSISLVPAELAGQISRARGVRRAQPIVFVPAPVRTPTLHSAQVVGHEIGGLGAPPVSTGRPVRARGEVVADDKLGIPIGAHITISGKDFEVVGLVHGLTLFGGQPSLYVPIADVQATAFNGFPLATGIGVKGHLSTAPPGMHVVTRSELIADLLVPLQNAIGAVDTVRLLLWIVAAAIIAAVVYLSALERLRDFAVFKATGASTWTILGGLVVEATLLSVVAAALSAGFARALVPVFPLAVEVPVRAQLTLLVVAVVIGVVASGFAARRASSVDPALAFGGP